MITYPSTHGVFETRRQGTLRDRARARRPGLHRRRQHERAGRRGHARQVRRRRLPPQPAQDLLHPARRRRPGRRPGLRRRATWRRSCPAIARPASAMRTQIGAVSAAPLRQRRGPADQLDVHPHDGQRRPAQGHPGGHAQRQLHRHAARAALRHAVHRAATAWWRTSASSTCARSRTPPASAPRTWPSA